LLATVFDAHENVDSKPMCNRSRISGWSV
jgi:hypothetical protein